LDHDYGPEIKPQIAYIIEEDCIGCTKCIDACPVDAINGAANLMHNVINDLCTGCELCIEPCPVDCIELIEVSEEQSLKIRKDSDHFFQLKNRLIQRKNKKSKLNKSISENLSIAESINKKLTNRNIDKEQSIKKLQTEMLNAQKTEKYITTSDIENLKNQL
jgi:formate hydrogenlyase subunit 6/NADH:ubiquinone oxidoreductase subunit I